MGVTDLGWVQAVQGGTTPPTNTKMLWYDENPGVSLMKYYDVGTGSWLTLIGSTIKTVEVITNSDGSKKLKMTLGDNSVVYSESLCCNDKNIPTNITSNTCPDTLFASYGTGVSDLTSKGYIGATGTKWLQFSQSEAATLALLR